MRISSTSFLTLIFIVGLFTNQTRLSAQNDTELSPNKFLASPPVSPNVANLGIHGTIPVNLFSGLPQIQIPLVTLEDRDLSIPISLSYHSDGAKPDMHPGWTGLGWSLSNAGGTITRIRKGVTDEADIANLNTDISYLGNFSDLDVSNWYTGSNLAGTLFGGTYFKDYEPDEFLFSCAGFSGKFFLNHKGDWVFTSNSGEKFEMIDVQLANNFQIDGNDLYANSPGGNYIHSFFLSGGGRRIFKQFTIRSNDGTVYTFGGTDNSVEYTRPNIISPSDGYDMIPTAWHLKKMESPNGNTITFNYKRDGVSFRESVGTNLFEYYGETTDNDWWIFENYQRIHSFTGRYRSLQYDILYPSYLEEIIGSNGKIVFESEHTNQLPYGIENNIDIIDVHLQEEYYSIYPKLTRVYLERNNKIIKDMRLTFKDQPDSRLMLTSVYQQVGNETLPPYVFHYEQTPLPEYNSLKVDHWGYYNGVNYFESLSNSHTFSWLDVDPYFQSRSPNPAFMQAGLLTKVEYPTGGGTNLEYEPNTYSKIANQYPFNVDNVPEKIAGGVRIKNISSYTSPGEELMKKEYFYTNDYSNGDLVSSGVLSGIPNYLEIDNFLVDNNGISQNFRYWNLSSNNFNPLSETDGRHVTYSKVVEKSSDGGYREISYSNHDNSIVEYLDEPALMHITNFHQSDKNSKHTSRQRERGKPILEKIHKSDHTLLQKKIFEYTIPQDEIYKVRCANRSFKEFYNVSTIIGAPTFHIKDKRGTAYLQYIFPVHLTSETVFNYDETGQNPISITTTSEYNGDHNLSRTETTNSNGHKYISTYKYPNDYLTSLIGKAPMDDSYNGILILKLKGINNNAIETLNFVERPHQSIPGNGVGTFVVDGTINSFGSSNNKVYPIAVYRLSIDEPLVQLAFQESFTEYVHVGNPVKQFVMDSRYEQVIDITNHSENGKPLEAKRTGGEPVSVLMDKDELRPLAQAIGAKYNDIAHTSFELSSNVSSEANGRWEISEVGGGWDSNTSKTGLLSFNLSQARLISSSVESSGSYTLSFWAKGGTGFVIKVDEVLTHTQTTSNNWSYYEITLPLFSNATVSLRGIGWGERIDELRLHPSHSLMSTYTNDPSSLLVNSITDPNNKSSYFEYDNFNRFQYAFDHNQNLISFNNYHYKGTGSIENFVHSATIVEEGKTKADISALTFSEVLRSYQYLDGLGRPIQTIGVNQSPLEKDIVQIIQYDIHGRESKQYLPYTRTSNNGTFRPNAVSEQSSFYNSSNFHATTSFPFSETTFEFAPLNRKKEQTASGEYWKKGSGNTLTMGYGTAVGPPIYNLQYPGAFGIVNQLTGLWVEQQTDEHNIHYWKFKDKLGRKVVDRKQAPNGKYTDTYYEYDDFGNLESVIQPNAIDELQTCFALNGPSVDFCSSNSESEFRYQYDERQRLIAKKIPGSGWTYYIYDILDRQVMSQDANQRANNQWTYTKYDRLGRSILTGLYTNPDNRIAIQNWITVGNKNGSIPLHEVPSATYTGYSSNVVPQNQNNTEVLSITYYDNYDFNHDGSNDASLVTDAEYAGNNVFYRLNGLITGSKVRVLGTNNWLTTTTWYDEYGRTVQIQSDNHKGGQDITHNQFDFAGRMLKNKRVHSIPGKQNITIRERFDYDHTGRVVNVYHQINNKNEIRLNNNNYNELNQLIEKNLHSTNYDVVATANYLQSIDYSYNIRGWLEKINDLNISTTVGGAEISLMEKGYIIIRYDGVKLANGEKSDLKLKSSMEEEKSDGVRMVTQKELEVKIENNTTIYSDSILINLIDKQITKSTLSNALSTLKERIYIQLTDAGVTDQEFIDRIINEVHDIYRDDWLRVTTNDDNNDLFRMRLDYTEGNANVNAPAQFNGNISNIAWQVAGQDIKLYGFTYDNMNRLTNAHFADYSMGIVGPIYFNQNRYDVSNIGYDLNGNISSLKREGMNGESNNNPLFGTIDNLNYIYTANRLDAVLDAGTNNYGFKDGTNQTTEYLYDANGNMIEDKNKGIIVEYNHLNLPTKVTFVNQYKSIEWAYDAVGNKLEKKTVYGNSVNTKDYISGIEYINDNIEAVYHGEGRLTVSISDVGISDGTNSIPTLNWQYEYSLNDHLGNSRVMFSDLDEDGLVDETEILQSQAYYPFGMVHEGTQSQQIGAQNKYQYNGKELNDDYGLGWTDYGARWYMADLGRWGAVDPLAEKFYNQTPYHYVTNNPLNVIDPDGRDTVVMNRSSQDYHRSDGATNVWKISFSLISNGQESPILDDEGNPIEMFMIGNADSDGKKGDNYLKKDAYTLIFQTRGKKIDKETGKPRSGYENEIHVVGSYVKGKTRGQFFHRGENYLDYDGCKGLCTELDLAGERQVHAATRVKNSIAALKSVRDIYDDHEDRLTGKKFILKTNSPNTEDLGPKPKPVKD